MNLANLSGTTTGNNVSSALNPGTPPSSQTIYEVPTLFEPNTGIATTLPTIAGSAQTTGQPLYWSNHT